MISNGKQIQAKLQKPLQSFHNSSGTIINRIQMQNSNEIFTRFFHEFAKQTKRH